MKLSPNLKTIKAVHIGGNKMKSRIILPIVLSAILLTSCGNSYVAKVGKQEIYKTNVEKVSHNGMGDWVLSGSTNAPDDSKILVTVYDKESDNYGNNGSESAKSPAKLAIVQDGKFKVNVNPIGLTDRADQKIGAKTKLLVFAVKNYNRKWIEPTIPKDIVNNARKSLDPKTVSISKSQNNYIKNLDKNSSKSKNDSSKNSAAVNKDSNSGNNDATSGYNDTEGENNAQTLSYGQLIKSDDFVGKSYHISKAQVMQAEEESGKTLLLAYIDDDPNHLFMILYNGKTSAVEDDYIDVQGILSTREEYKTNIGGSNKVPSLIAKNITVTGHYED